MRLRLIFGVLFLPLALFVTKAAGFEVDEFRSGMGRDKVRELLASWKFDKIQEAGREVLLAYDNPEKNGFRQFRFSFCNDKLVGLEQTMKPSASHFIIISNNYIAKYGQPFKVDTGINVVSAGEKNAIALNWRRNNEIIGVRYAILAGAEQLAIIYETPNTCWQSPRAP